MLGVNLHSFSSFAIEAYFIFWIELSRVLPYLCNLSKTPPFFNELGLASDFIWTLEWDAQKTGQYCFSIDQREGQLASSRKVLTLSFLRLMLRKVSRMPLRLLLLFYGFAILFLATKQQESSQMSPVGIATSPQFMILTIFQRLVAVAAGTCGNWLALKLIQSSYFIYPCAATASCAQIFSNNCNSSSGNLTNSLLPFSSSLNYLWVTCLLMAFLSVEAVLLALVEVFLGVVCIIISIFYCWLAYNNINK